MSELLMLKFVINFSDELVIEQGQENARFRRFCKQENFVNIQPCDANKLIIFPNIKQRRNSD